MLGSKRIGYARVSTRGQTLDLQRSALKSDGCDHIYEDTIRGTKDHHAALSRAIEVLREGDTFVVWKLDRLGHSLKDVLAFTSELSERNINFVSLNDAVDTTTPSGRAFYSIMASLAQMERELMIERMQAGLEAARDQGRASGRKRIMTESKIRSAKRLLHEGIPPKEVALNLGVSVPTLYRWVPATDTSSRRPA